MMRRDEFERIKEKTESKLRELKVAMVDRFLEKWGYNAVVEEEVVLKDEVMKELIGEYLSLKGYEVFTVPMFSVRKGIWEYVFNSERLGDYWYVYISRSVHWAVVMVSVVVFAVLFNLVVYMGVV